MFNCNPFFYWLRPLVLYRTECTELGLHRLAPSEKLIIVVFNVFVKNKNKGRTKQTIQNKFVYRLVACMDIKKPLCRFL